MRRFIATIAGIAAIGLAVPGTSSAGGWVVVSLDSTPVVEADRDVAVGFTVLRHGVTPESWDDLEIVITRRDGGVHRFDAVQQGAVGHHVATINVPDDGDYGWKVVGPFVDAELGTLIVNDAPSGGAGWRWDALQWGTASLALAMALLAIVDFRRTRRRRPTAPAAA